MRTSGRGPVSAHETTPTANLATGKSNQYKRTRRTLELKMKPGVTSSSETVTFEGLFLHGYLVWYTHTHVNDGPFELGKCADLATP
eukprot:9468111-Pyramimonas_sp.AAC.2